ncbi:hypothetical protein TNCV_3522771 [Trichonephila clavipes]|uniref:Uncharacterized protein n=1 Tax=Trichonephila clavipes TaxID=2585209 RepID=A0A8X7BHC0_TRICX|nr:hypothetical protein TNCV_3522771 [Trichonephila clavipes]
MPSFFEIFLFELTIEIVGNYTMKEQSTSISENETSVSFKPIFMNGANSAIPVVCSVTVNRICQAVELSSVLAPLNPELMQIQPNKVKQITPIPAVYSVTLYRMCEALDLKVELRPPNERPNFVSKKQRQVPVVHSPVVFCICQALELHVHLANTRDT